MPDWTYQPILQPLLFHLAPERARDVTLNVTGKLGKLPFGTSLIDLMGHMKPPSAVSCTALGIEFPGPVGLACRIDTEALAARSFAHFGFGFLEVGPVTIQPVTTTNPIIRDVENRTIHYPDEPVNGGVSVLKDRLEELRQRKALSIPLGVRIACQPGSEAMGEEWATLISQLADTADFFTLECPSNNTPVDWNEQLAILRDRCSDQIPRLLINVRPDTAWSAVKQIVDAAFAIGIRGVNISGGIQDSERENYRTLGPDAQMPTLTLIRQLRANFGDQLVIMASGGIQEPKDALAFLEAGATLIQIDCGFVYSGPGLPKRINEAIAYYRQPSARSTSTAPIRFALLANPDWFWFLLLGLGLTISAIVVWIVAITRTVLPYDESFAGLSRDQLIAINPHLLAFMAHDRVTVAGTMLSTGLLYTGLAWYGVRRGYQWAREVIIVSASIGFLSFFLFLGYGYFDPLHAVLSAGLLPLLLLGAFARRADHVQAVAPNLTNNWRWLRALKGQLLFVMIGIGLIVGGFSIAGVGVTTVFVPEDLQFMNTTASTLQAASTRLLPLIAHDRAGFGGNLVTVGAAVLFISLWGFRQGERWMWWTLASGGIPGFLGAFGVHLAVCYVDLWHLFPVVVALLFYIVGLILAFPFFQVVDEPLPVFQSVPASVQV